MESHSLGSFHQLFFTNPPQDLSRSDLFEYGIGYQHLMGWLLIAPECKGNSRLCNYYVSKPTSNLAIELLRHPYQPDRHIGVKILDPIPMMRKYLPEAVSSAQAAGIFAAFADRWFNTESEKSGDMKAVVEAQAAAAMAHMFAQTIGIIPEPVWGRIRSAFIGEQH